MTELVTENLQAAKKKQKTWYDRGARERSFQPGDHVLVMLPTTINKLQAQWKGPYKVVKQVGKVDYRLELPGRRRCSSLFHVNMLRKWHVPTAVASTFMAEESEEEDDDDVITWDEGSDGDTPVVGEKLDAEQKGDLEILLEDFAVVFKNVPGRTTLTEHRIHTGTARPVRMPPYRTVCHDNRFGLGVCVLRRVYLLG